MSGKTKWEAARLAIEGVGVFILAVFVVWKYGDILTKINWPLVVLVCLVAYGAYMVYRWNDTLDNFNLFDMVMSNGRLDDTKVFKIIMAGFLLWIIGQKILGDPNADVIGYITLGIGAFCGESAWNRAVDAYKAKPAVASQDTNMNILPGAQIAAAPAPAEAATEQASTPRAAPKWKRK